MNEDINMNLVNEVSTEEQVEQVKQPEQLETQVQDGALTKAHDISMKTEEASAPESMVEVSEAEYYNAIENHRQGVEPIFSISEYGPFDENYLIERGYINEDIPIDERAIVETYTKEHVEIIERARMAGAFNGGNGTVLIPETAGVLYAGIWDKGKEGVVIKILFKDSTGEFTKPVELDYAMLAVIAQSSFDFANKDNPFYREISNFHKKTMTAMLSRMVQAKIRFNYSMVLRMIWKYRDQLPVHELMANNPSAEAIYCQILKYVEKHPRDYHSATKYIRLRKDDMDDIASLLDMDKNEVCKELKEYGLLYLTGSACGYQTKVKFKGVAENFYCVIKDFGTQEIQKYEPTVLEDGARILHDGMVVLPQQLYHQLFRDESSKSSKDSSSSKGSASKNNKRIGGYTSVEW